MKSQILADMTTFITTMFICFSRVVWLGLIMSLGRHGDMLIPSHITIACYDMINTLRVMIVRVRNMVRTFFKRMFMGMYVWLWVDVWVFDCGCVCGYVYVYVIMGTWMCICM